MASSPWNKRFIIGTKKNLPAPTTQPNQMPSVSTPISIKLNGSELVFENSSWRTVDGGGSVVSSNAAVNEEIKKLRKENQDLKEQNNLLEFKFQLLLDMATATGLDLEVMKENERAILERHRKKR